MAWKLRYILRGSNQRAYALAVVVASLPIKEMIFLHIYHQPESSITTNQVNEIDEAYSSWIMPIVHYLSAGKLLDNRVATRKIQV